VGYAGSTDYGINRIEHSTMARPDQILRMKKLNVQPSFLMNHVRFYGAAYRDQIRKNFRLAWPMALAGLLGGTAGAIVLLNTPQTTFLHLVPWLLLVAAIIAEKTFDEWLSILADIEGQWAVVQNSWEVANDPSLRANGMIASFDDAEGNRRELITNPVQFDETPATLRRGPLFAEHTDEVLRELGLTDDRLVELKIAGAIT